MRSPPRPRVTGTNLPRRQLLLATMSVLLVVAGCATPAPADREPPQVFSGRLALTVAATAEAAPPPPVRAASGLFELAGTASAGRLTLTTPLGATLAEARWSPNEALLQAPEGERRYRSLEALTTDLVGEPLPIGALFAWLGGRPATGAASRALADGEGFEQFGWRVELGRLADGRVRLARNGQLRVELRLVLDAATPP